MTKNTLLTELNKNNAFNDLSLIDVAAILGKPIFRISKIVINFNDTYSRVYTPEEYAYECSDYAGNLIDIPRYFMVNKEFSIPVFDADGSSFSSVTIINENAATELPVTAYQDGDNIKITFNINLPENPKAGKGTVPTQSLEASDCFIVIKFVQGEDDEQ